MLETVLENAGFEGGSVAPAGSYLQLSFMVSRFNHWRGFSLRIAEGRVQFRDLVAIIVKIRQYREDLGQDISYRIIDDDRSVPCNLNWSAL